MGMMGFLLQEEEGVFNLNSKGGQMQNCTYHHEGYYVRFHPSPEGKGIPALNIIKFKLLLI